MDKLTDKDLEGLSPDAINSIHALQATGAELYATRFPYVLNADGHVRSPGEGDVDGVIVFRRPKNAEAKPAHKEITSQGPAHYSDKAEELGVRVVVFPEGTAKTELYEFSSLAFHHVGHRALLVWMGALDDEAKKL